MTSRGRWCGKCSFKKVTSVVADFHIKIKNTAAFQSKNDEKQIERSPKLYDLDPIFKHKGGKSWSETL